MGFDLLSEEKEKKVTDVIKTNFSPRIPRLQRLKIQKAIPENFTMDEVGLLKMFGKQSIANPYKLIANEQVLL